MGPARITSDRAWVVKHLQPLIEAGRSLLAFDEDLTDRQLPATYNAGPWTGLKLIVLKNYIKPYLEILADRFPVAYVDLFAGPGLDRIGEEKVPLPGSPLVPLMIREASKGRMFRHVFLCERDPQRDSALRRRVLGHLPEGVGWTMHQGDANAFVKRLPALMEENGIKHSLVFLDPEGMQWRWDSMVHLLQKVKCDLIVNFPSTAIQRNSTSKEVATRQTIASHLGVPTQDLPYPVDVEWAIDRYREGLRELGRNISTEIRVAANGAFHYHLIPAVRETRGGSRWFYKILPALRDRVERLHGEILRLIAQQIEGGLGSLDES